MFFRDIQLFLSPVIPHRSICSVSMVGILLSLLLFSCAPHRAKQQRASTPLLFKDITLAADTIWHGDILIDGTVTSARGTTLRIEPGTTISFAYHDRDQDGLGDSSLVVEGSIIAEGTPDQPIHFVSAGSNPRAGDWLELRIDHSPLALFSNVLISHSAHSIHAHFTKLTITDSTIRDNIDGCRLGESKATIRNNLVEHNVGKGLNYRNSAVEISNNIIRNNRNGIFIFENNRQARIEQNNIVMNDIGIRLGDFYQGDVTVSKNWWGTVDTNELALHRYDKQDDPTLGTISISPVSAWHTDAGPQQSANLLLRNTVKTGGFIDATPIYIERKPERENDHDAVLVASWDGMLSLITTDGDLLWQQQTGEVVDSSPIVVGDLIIVQNWRPEIVALKIADGSVVWRTALETSLHDDHRQGGGAVLNNKIYFPAWNGTLYGLNPTTGNIITKTELGAPLRSTALIDSSNDGRLYIASGAGILSALNAKSAIIWQQDLGAPLLSSPITTPFGIAICDKSGTIRMIDPAGGSTIWRQELNETIFYSSPLIADDALIIPTAGGSLWKLDVATGEVIWRQTLSGPSYATASRSGNLLFVGNNSGELEVFDARSGKFVTNIETGSAIQGSPLILGGTLYIGSRDNLFHIYDIEVTNRTGSEDTVGERGDGQP